MKPNARRHFLLRLSIISSISRAMSIFSILCLGYCGCNQVEPISQPVFQPMADDVQPKPENKSIEFTYQGKYARENRLREMWLQIPELRRKAVANIAQKLGLFYQDRDAISLQLRDWQATDQDHHYRVIQKVTDGKMSWHIEMICEHLMNREEEFQILFARAFVEAVLAEISHMRNLSLPGWLQRGIIYYGIGKEDLVLQKFTMQLLEDPRHLTDIIHGIESDNAPFPEMESYFALLYFREVYGENTLKKFLMQILSTQNWQDELQKVTNADFVSFSTNAKLFTINWLQNRYWPNILEYRKALHFYLDNQYLQAIPHFQNLFFQFPDSFMSGNLVFWTGMCYYRLERYTTAAQYFEQTIHNLPNLCAHLAVARYRYAMCLYYQRLIDKAVLEMADFIRDFPFHDLHSSAFFFLADCFEQKALLPRAYDWYEQFITKFPKHTRRGEALLKIGHIARQLQWYRCAKAQYRMSMETDLPTSDKKHAQRILQEIEQCESGRTPSALAAHLNSLVGEFAQNDMAQKQAILDELSRIGKLAIPWMQRLISMSHETQVSTFIDMLSHIESAQSIPAMTALLKKHPSCSKEILTAMIYLGIAPSFLETVLFGEISDMEDKMQGQVRQAIEFVLWDSSESLRSKFPELLKQLNGTSQEQLEIMEKISLQNIDELLPVLLRLVQDGKSKSVQMKAIRELVQRPDRRSIPVLSRLFSRDDAQFHIAAMKALANVGEYPLRELQRQLQSPTPQAQMTALEILAQASTAEHRRVLIRTLASSDLKMREAAKDKLLQLPTSQSIPLLLQDFVEDGQALHFYVGIVEILERITGKRLPYEPDMTSEQRKQIITGWPPQFN